jgi:hypothetical protein
MNTGKYTIVYLSAALVGLASWIIVMALEDVREAWDSPTYFVGALPLMLLASGFLGWIVPGRAWWLGLAMVIPQVVITAVMAESDNLLGPGILLFGAVAALCAGCAHLGARLFSAATK